MSRRSFFRSLVLGVVGLPIAVKCIAEKSTLSHRTADGIKELKKMKNLQRANYSALEKQMENWAKEIVESYRKS